MTIIEHALRDLERRILEQHARIEDAKQALLYLEQEKTQILAEVARATQELEERRGWRRE